jgi:hypothetical protein
LHCPARGVWCWVCRAERCRPAPLTGRNPARVLHNSKPSGQAFRVRMSRRPVPKREHHVLLRSPT